MRSLAFHEVHSLWNQIALKCECVTTHWPPGAFLRVSFKVKGQVLVAATPSLQGPLSALSDQHKWGSVCGCMCVCVDMCVSVCVCRHVCVDVWGAAVTAFGADRASEDPWTGKMRMSSRRLHKNVSLSLLTAGLGSPLYTHMQSVCA